MIPGKKPIPNRQGVKSAAGQLAGNPRPQTARVMQPAMAMTAPMRKPPVAPPVYRPEAGPRAVQAKLISPAPDRKQVLTQPLKRPHLAPKVFQPLRARPENGQPGSRLTRSTAPTIQRTAKAPVSIPSANKLNRPGAIPARTSRPPAFARPGHAIQRMALTVGNVDATIRRSMGIILVRKEGQQAPPPQCSIAESRDRQSHQHRRKRNSVSGRAWRSAGDQRHSRRCPKSLVVTQLKL